MNSTHPVSPMMVVRPNTPTNRPNLASSNGGGTPALPVEQLESDVRAQ